MSLIKAFIITGYSPLIMHKPNPENITNENMLSVSHINSTVSAVLI